MNADSPSAQAAQKQLVVDVEGSGDMDPAEADLLLRECLSLMDKRLAAAIRPALADLHAATPQDRNDATSKPSVLERDMSHAVRSTGEEFVSRFSIEFKQTFQRRREGKLRTRGERDESVALAMVDHGSHTATVALKSAVLAMREATLEEAFALDLRVRTLLREAPRGVSFDNPWSADYICDAFGNVGRELWPEHGLWRPIMERLVRATTQQVAALHRELNVLLQDRDVLPTLRVRTRARGASQQPPELHGRALYDKLFEVLDSDARAALSVPSATAGGAAPTVGTMGGNAAGRELPRDAQGVGNFQQRWPASCDRCEL